MMKGKLKTLVGGLELVLHLCVVTPYLMLDFLAVIQAVLVVVGDT